MKVRSLRKQGAQPTRRLIGYVVGTGAQLTGAAQRPFYRIRLRSAQAVELTERLESASASEEPRWYTLTALATNPNRLGLTEHLRLPAFEQAAAAVYLRGEAFRITGKGASCNIDFSTVGASLLAERLRTALSNMDEWLELRIPNRKRQLIEFVTDRELLAASSAEIDKLALAGAQLAAEFLAHEDFSDWEEADA